MGTLIVEGRERRGVLDDEGPPPPREAPTHRAGTRPPSTPGCARGHEKAPGTVERFQGWVLLGAPCPASIGFWFDRLDFFHVKLDH